MTTGVLLVATSIFLVREQNRRAQAQADRLKAQIEQSVEQGLRWQISRNYARAAESYSKALERDPSNVRALYNLSVTKKELYNIMPDPDPRLLEVALTLCDRALRVSPQDQIDDICNMYNLKGVLLKKLERYPEAAEAYAEAVKLNPESVASLDNLAIVQVLIGNLEEATANLHTATELAGTESGCNWRPWRMLGTVQLFTSDDAALDTLDQAIECNRTDTWTRLLRARAYLELPGRRNESKALVAIMAADEFANERDPRIKRTLSLALLRNERYDEAIAAAAAAKDLGDDSIMGDLVAAIASARLGRRDEARRILDAAVARWPTDLSSVDAFHVTANAGILWFERAAPLFELKTEALDFLDDR